MPKTVGSMFAGIGGFDVAFEEAGFETVWQIEKDPFCLDVLAEQFPKATRYTDVYDCHNLPHVDVITAGFPCQPFSLAGKRHGSDDERYLVPEMMRIINEVKPHVVFLENVSGFTTLNDGNEFSELLQWFAEIGYDGQWHRVRASDVGAPHQRERWFAVLYAQDESYPSRCS